MTIAWIHGHDLHTGLAASRIYKIAQNDGRWQLRVRDREEPENVPIEDLWITLGHYHSPYTAMIHADYNEEKAA